MPQISSLFASLLIAASTLIAISQYAQARELRQALTASGQQQQVLQTQIQRLEDNLQSAGVQMQHLSDMAQEANQRAAACMQ
jgi:hypothetical protein